MKVRSDVESEDESEDEAEAIEQPVSLEQHVPLHTAVTKQPVSLMSEATPRHSMATNQEQLDKFANNDIEDVIVTLRQLQGAINKNKGDPEFAQTHTVATWKLLLEYYLQKRESFF